MISKHVMGNSYSQSQIVSSVYGSPVNKGGSLEDAAYAMRVNTGFQTYLNYSPLSYSQAQGRINARRPFYMSLNWSNSNDWHAVVCDGYNNNYLHIVDPWYGCANIYVGYSECQSGTDFQSGHGRWVNGFYI